MLYYKLARRRRLKPEKKKEYGAFKMSCRGRPQDLLHFRFKDEAGQISHDQRT